VSKAKTKKQELEKKLHHIVIEDEILWNRINKLWDRAKKKHLFFADLVRLGSEKYEEKNNSV